MYQFGDGQNPNQYEYHIKDHLGNTRIVVSQNGVELQQSAYYPFGMSFMQTNSGSDNKYLYNGKELQDDLLGNTQLDWYDYGARMYDAQLGRWFVVDPMAELYYSTNPYAYVGNNPIFFLDLDGKKWVDFSGNVVFEDGAFTRHATHQHRAMATALRQTRTGREQFDKLVNSKNYVAINVDYLDLSGDENIRGAFNPKPYKDEKGLYKSKKSSLANPYKISLFKGPIGQYAKKMGVGYWEALAAVLGHEIEHNEEYNIEMAMEWANTENRESISHVDREHEQKPIEIRDEIINQSKENNKPIKNTTWNDFYQWVNSNNLWNKVTY